MARSLSANGARRDPRGWQPNDFAQWQKWNPWRDTDPSQKETCSENTVGVGAWYTWEGNDDVGKGKMTLTESVQDQKVVEDLHFIEPFESEAVVTFTLTPAGDQTTVTWGFVSQQDFMARAFGLFVDMDAMLGADFQRGLDKLEPLAEAVATERVAAAAGGGRSGGVGGAGGGRGGGAGGGRDPLGEVAGGRVPGADAGAGPLRARPSGLVARAPRTERGRTGRATRPPARGDAAG